MFERARCWLKLGQGCLRVSVNLCSLTRKAATSPNRNFSSKSMPNKLGRYQPLRGSCPRVRQRVYCVEHLLTPVFWHYRPCYSCRNVTKKGECSVFEGDVFYTEVSNGGPIILDVRVILLIGSHGPVIQSRFDGIYGYGKTRYLRKGIFLILNQWGSLLVHCVDSYARECVSDDIILACNMLDIRSELGNCCKVP